jgi:hypothetical protein
MFLGWRHLSVVPGTAADIPDTGGVPEVSLECRGQILGLLPLVTHFFSF